MFSNLHSLRHLFCPLTRTNPKEALFHAGQNLYDLESRLQHQISMRQFEAIPKTIDAVDRAERVYRDLEQLGAIQP